MNTAMKRLLTVILTCTALILALSDAQAGAKIEHWKTRNGASVHYIASRALPILDVQVDFAAGSMFDPEGKSGLAALTRSTLDLGAGQRDETAIAEQLADLGATLSGGADTDRSSIALRTLSARDKREAALAVLRDVIQHPRFEAAVVEREQARSIATLKEAQTRPDSIAGKAFWAALYPNHPYGRQASPESLATLNRDDLSAFHAQYYSAANARINLVGDISRLEAERIAESLSQGLPEGQAAELPAAPELPPGATHKLEHPASQAHIYLGLPAVERGHPDFFPLLVGNYTLGGGGFVSRLMKEIRDKRGLAYSVYSYFAPLKQRGPFQIGLQTRRDQASEATALAKEILGEFVAQGPSEAELAAAQANLTGSFPLRLDSNKKLLDNLSAIAFYQLPLDYLETYQDKVRAVTAEEIKAAFARHLSLEHLQIVTVAGQ